MDHVRAIASRTESLLRQIDLETRADSLRALNERLESDDFRVLVIGEFKRGKSTLINALLGEEVLPSSAVPCTAVINEIMYGETKRARIHFRTDFVVQGSATKSLPDEVQRHIQRHARGAIPPLDIVVSDLKSYVTIRDPANDHSESVFESPYSHVEIEWPLELCKAGVRIVDSPGLNEHTTRTNVTKGYLSRADAIVFVISCQSPVSKTELDYINSPIRAAGYEDIFFVANRFDGMKRPKERDEMVRHVQQKLGVLTSFGNDGIFFVSALDALDGKLENDPARIASSKVPEFSQKLAHHLTHNRGSIKLLAPLKTTTEAIVEARTAIPEIRKTLDMTVSEFEERYERLRPTLESSRARRHQLVTKLELDRMALRNEVETLVQSRQDSLCRSIGLWFEELERSEVFTQKFSPLSPKESSKAIAKEAIELLSAKLQSEQNAWQNDTLVPLVKHRVESLHDTMERHAHAILTDLDLATTRFYGNDVSDELDQKDVPTLERIAAAAGGFIVGGVGSATLGATFGYKEMLKSLIPALGVGFTLGILGILNPLVLIPALFAAGGIQGLMAAGSTARKMRAHVRDKLVDKLTASSGRMASEFADSVFECTEQIQLTVAQGLDVEIKTAEERVAAARRDLNQNREEVRQKRSALDDIYAEFAELEARCRQIQASLQPSLFGD